MNIWERRIIQSIKTELRNLFDVEKINSNIKLIFESREDGVIELKLSGKIKIFEKEVERGGS
ncbi:MAG: hypothetical protein ACOC5T_06190 [Elusimicrobiota bacterium]